MGAPAVFQRLMYTVLAGLIHNTCMVYLYDAVYSNSLGERKEKLKSVFDRLRQHTLLLQPDKCYILMTDIRFLRHVINGQDSPYLEKDELLLSILYQKIPNRSNLSCVSLDTTKSSSVS